MNPVVAALQEFRQKETIIFLAKELSEKPTHFLFYHGSRYTITIEQINELIKDLVREYGEESVFRKSGAAIYQGDTFLAPMERGKTYYLSPGQKIVQTTLQLCDDSLA